MIYEFLADSKDRLLMNASCQDINSFLDAADLSVPSRIQLLSLFHAAANKDTKICAQTGDRPNRPAGLRKLIVDKKLDEYYEEQCKNFLVPLSLKYNCTNIDIFPPGSFLVHLSFTLSKPYINQDDTDFYIIDNPVKKEWVFKVPYVAPSQWKGALRSAMVQELVSDLRNGKIDKNEFTDERIRLYRLFGNEKDGTGDFLNKALAHYLVRSRLNEGQSEQITPETLNSKTKEIAEAFKSELVSRRYKQGDIEGFQGNLHFYPTYFGRIGLEVINPHDRETGAGKNPIYFECVPEGTNGTFNLLFVPLTGPELNDDEAKKDLKAVARGVKAMITRYGFGAKTSSGFGVADVSWEDAIIRPEAEFQQHWKDAWREEVA